ncbi:MAG: efflux transporter, family, subunit [Anaerosporomusa subterranea]|nr:efflux transporter, family, subunit [Anaerosporomusa subterranea]
MEENKTVKRRSLTAGGKGKLVAGICLLACLAFGLHWVLAKPASSQSQRPSDMKPAVKAAVLAKADLSKNIQLTGKTVPEAQVDIAAKYSGKISQVLVALGQSVTPGQVMPLFRPVIIRQRLTMTGRRRT